MKNLGSWKNHHLSSQLNLSWSSVHSNSLFISNPISTDTRTNRFVNCTAMSAPTASSHQKKQRTSAQHDSSHTICSSRDPTGSAAPTVSPVTSAVLLGPRRTSGNDNFQCCLCLEFHNYENHTNLRPECFHRFCETCYNTEETVRQLNLDKCPACQKDLDETVSVHEI
jgi:hypothetical protein